MIARREASFHRAGSLQDALAALDERGAQGQAIAGGTWLMRATLRGESTDRAYVSLCAIEALKQVVVTHAQVEIGACVTHAGLASALASLPEFQGLRFAAGASANPAVRNMATVGGNLCAAGFAAADLVPALLAVEARVEVGSRTDTDIMTVEEFLALRHRLEPGRLVQRILLPRRPPAPILSAHARLPLRRAGDYPVAIVSVALTLKPDRTVERARVALGAVESAARRWTQMEEALLGRVLDAQDVADRARALTDGFVGRDGVEAPGWYRVSVLPVLMARAIGQLRPH